MRNLRVKNDRPYKITIFATVLNLPQFLLPPCIIFIPPYLKYRVMSREDLTDLSLNKSKILSPHFFITTDRLLQCFTDSNPLAQESRKTLNVFANLSETLSSINSSLPRTQIFFIIMAEKFDLDAFLNRFVFREIHARSSRRSRAIQVP